MNFRDIDWAWYLAVALMVIAFPLVFALVAVLSR